MNESEERQRINELEKRIEVLEQSQQELYHLIEKVAYGVVEHTSTINRKIHNKINAIKNV